ncbi:MAG: glucose-6-phosphate isomerase [Proteobacteria bacterium]|nr:glucose-6-phosphate isomerase [Pseudomonadota bacterium]
MKENATEQFDILSSLASGFKKKRIIDLFKSDPNRMDTFSIETAGLHLDASKQLLDNTVYAQLTKFAVKMGVPKAIENMFRGGIVNPTENRAALHVALRSSKSADPWIPKDLVSDVQNVLSKIENFVDGIVNGRLRSSVGVSITDILMIGVGGSNLGPKLVCKALRETKSTHLRVKFLDHLDGREFDKLKNLLKPESTLCVIASKSFTTSETLQNAAIVEKWMNSSLKDNKLTKSQFIAITADEGKALSYGIPKGNIFRIWDWVGGRYSVWSAMGLPIALKFGFAAFKEFLAGAELMDDHFRSAPIDRNMPIMLGMLGVWNVNFLGAHSYAVIPYEERLRELPSYLQQLEMESNGKRVGSNNTPIDYDSAPVTWGALGTDAQHSFCQLLHQGTRFVPVDFIISLTPPKEYVTNHDVLLANCIAQAKALMIGGNSGDTNLYPYKEIIGNRPSSIISMEVLDMRTLGALIALYEHKTYVQSVIWKINPFDQWGVNLGKEFATSILTDLSEGNSADQHDPSTEEQIRRYKNLRNNS